MTILAPRPAGAMPQRVAPSRPGSPAAGSEVRPAGRAAPAELATVAPPRDGYLDIAKALATCCVVLGHWLVTAIGLGADGSWVVSSPLTQAPALAWVTVALQPLTVFFAVGGLTSAASYARAVARGQGAGAWIGARARRLLAPAGIALGWLAVSAAALALASVPYGTVRTIVVLVLQPLWFVAIYLVIAVLTPLALRARERFGWAVPVALAAIVALTDFLRYGPLSAQMPGWVGLINVLPGWLFAFQCGLTQARWPLRGRGALVLFGGGLATYLVALACGYPPTPMGAAVAGRINSHPPSLVVVACAAMFLGLAWAGEPWLRRHAGASVALARLTGWVGPRAMPVLCWHMAALALLTGALAVAGALAGTAAPLGALGGTGPAFWPGRIVLLPLAAAVLALLARPGPGSRPKEM